MRGRMFLFLVLTWHISLPNYIFVYNDTTYTIYAPLLYSSWYAHYLERSVSLLFIIVYNFPNGKLLYISYAAHREKGNIFFYYYQSIFSVATHNITSYLYFEQNENGNKNQTHANYKGEDVVVGSMKGVGKKKQESYRLS